MSTTQTYRVGLVGAGYVSEFHIKALKRLPNVRLVGITDLDTARAQATGLPVFASLAAMAIEGLDVVHVLTPPHTHVNVALEALSLGCHVLVEKPLATSVEDCDRLIAARGDRRVCVNHSLLGDSFVRRALQTDIGEVLAVDILRSSNYPPYRGGPLPPQYREGGYPFRDLGVHALYLLQEFLGKIEDASSQFRCSGARESDPNIHFDEWRAQVRCARGTGNIYLSWNVKPLQNLIIVQGTRGTLRCDLFSLYVTRRRNTPLPKAIERIANSIGESVSAAGQTVWGAAKFVTGYLRQYEGLHNFIHSFYDALATGQPMPVSLEDARETVRWTEQLSRDADYAKEKFYRAYQPTGRAAVVVTGANGQLGSALVKRLLADNATLRLFVRRLPAPEVLHHPNVEVVLGELGDPAAVDGALKNATAVYHVGAAMGGGWAAHEAGTITGTRNVVEACLKHNVPKLIYVSSLSVIDWAVHPSAEPVTETSPLEPAPQQRGSYTQSKLEAERIVRAAVEERKLPAVIVRPGKIWSETGPLIDAAVAIRAGQRLIVIGDDAIELPLVHVDDVVDGLLLAGKFSGGEIFQLVDKDTMSREELIRLYTLAREPQLKATRVSMGLACFLARGVEWLGKVLGRAVPISPYRLKSAYVPLSFDCTKAREKLGWRPRVGSAKALRALFGKAIR